VTRKATRHISSSRHLKSVVICTAREQASNLQLEGEYISKIEDCINIMNGS